MPAPQLLPAAPAIAARATPAPPRLSPAVQRVLDNCRKQVQITTGYDPAYTSLPYPGGDVDAHTGVCADVIVRGFRANGLDLQKAVHEDMTAHFDSYPRKWGLRRPDPNIDHRRVANLQTYFTRQGWSVKGVAPNDFRPGDVVAWQLPGNHLHIGIVSDKKDGLTETPLVIHNMGWGTHEENVLLVWPIIGHYRGLPAR